MVKSNRRQFIKAGALWVPSLFFIGRAAAQSFIVPSRRTASRQGVAGGGGPSYLLQEDFNGTGYDLAWTEAGATIAPDDTTHPADGAQELKLLKNSGATPTITSPNFTASASIDFFYSLYISDVATQNQLVQFMSNATPLVSLYLRATGRLQLYDEVTFFQSSPADALSANTQYWVWVRLNLTTGDAQLAFAVDQTRPSSGTKFDSDAAVLTTGGTINNIIIQNTVNPCTVFNDKVRVDNDPIGSNPT